MNMGCKARTIITKGKLHSPETCLVQGREGHALAYWRPVRVFDKGAEGGDESNV